MTKSKDTQQLFLDLGLDLITRTFAIHGYIDEAMLRHVYKAFHLLDAKKEPITISLDTDGGEVEAGMGIYDLIKNCRSVVTVRVLQKAHSMGSIILQAADHREAYPHASIMHHAGETGYTGHPNNIAMRMKFDKRYNYKLSLIMVDRINAKRIEDGEKKITIADFDRHDLWDRYLLADEAVSWGLLDSIYQLEGSK